MCTNILHTIFIDVYTEFIDFFFHISLNPHEMWQKGFFQLTVSYLEYW
jgi:hypothetical protein